MRYGIIFITGYALLFLFRHVLEKEFEQIEGVVRAKRRTYIPTVLSRDEVDRVIRHLPEPQIGSRNCSMAAACACLNV